MVWDIMMVNFMCQLAWATGCPNIGPNIFLGVSGRLFLGEINAADWVKQMALPPVGGPHLISCSLE